MPNWRNCKGKAGGGVSGFWRIWPRAVAELQSTDSVNMKGLDMKNYLLPAMFAVAVSSAPAFAADLGRMVAKAPPAPAYVNPWDVAIGAAVATDYNFRGISQSDRGPSVTSYFEGRYNATKDFQWYAGIAGYSVKLPTDPTAEIDLYGGVRATFGAFVLDLGLMYYYYPKETQQFIDPTLTFVTSNPNLGFGPYTFANTDYLEFYAKGAYTFNDYFSMGAQIYYTDDWLGTSATGTWGVLNAKFTAPANASGFGAFLSGEVGKYWFGTGNFFGAPLVLPDYTAWNVGVGFTYKAITLDLRYYDTDASPAECFALTSDIRGVNSGTGTSRWCSDAYVAKLSFDTTLSALK